MGAHISTVPNHQTLRVTSLKTRFLVALAGTFGLELDIRKLSQEEREELRQFIRLRDELSPIVYWGRQHRLWSPFKGNKTAAWMFVAEGRELERATRLQHFYDEWRDTVAEGVWAARPDADGSVVDVELPGRLSASPPAVAADAAGQGTVAKAVKAASTAVGDRPPNSGRLKPFRGTGKSGATAGKQSNSQGGRTPAGGQSRSSHPSTGAGSDSSSPPVGMGGMLSPSTEPPSQQRAMPSPNVSPPRTGESKGADGAESDGASSGGDLGLDIGAFGDS